MKLIKIIGMLILISFFVSPMGLTQALTQQSDNITNTKPVTNSINKLNSLDASTDNISITSSNYTLEHTAYTLTYTAQTTGSVNGYLIYLNSTLNLTTTQTSHIYYFSAGVYNVTVLLNTTIGYTQAQTTLYVIGMVFTPPNGTTVSNGNLHVHFDYKGQNPANIIHFDEYFVYYMYPNGSYITLIDSLNTQATDVAVPIFNNGSNLIIFQYYFSTFGTGLIYNITYNGNNIVPALNVHVGDYWIYVEDEFSPTTLYVNNYSGVHYVVNLTVISTPTPLLANISVTIYKYGLLNHSFLSAEFGWSYVSTINGYIEKTGGNVTDFNGLSELYFIFTGMQKGENIAIFNNFETILGKSSESSWNGIKTWSMNPITSLPSSFSANVQIMQLNGVMASLQYYIEDFEFLNFYLVQSNYLPIPQKENYNQVSFEQGKSTDLLSWNMNASYGGSYNIYENGSSVQTGTWSPGIETVYDASSLAPGFYNITIVFSDSFGLSSTYTTYLKITPKSAPVTTTTTEIQTTTTTSIQTKHVTDYVITVVLVGVTVIAFAAVLYYVEIYKKKNKHD